jgi:hypothetical protein
VQTRWYHCIAWFHTATGEHLQELEDFFRDVLTTPLDNPRPCPDGDLEKE